MRIEKEKEQERKKSGAYTDGSGTSSASPMEDDRKPAALPSTNDAGDNLRRDMMPPLPPPASRSRRDSFDEEILDLPGLDNLDVLGMDYLETVASKVTREP